MKNFEDLIAWKKSRVLVKKVYQAFFNCRDYSFRDQAQRAAVSIMNNIAEGFERKGDKEFIRFANISLGSCGELRSMLYSAQDLNYLSVEIADELKRDCVEVRRIVLGLIIFLRNPAHGGNVKSDQSSSPLIRTPDSGLRTDKYV